MNGKVSFKKWLQDMYTENCAEHEAFQLPPYQLKEYFSKYKWWLKREYKRQNPKLDQ